VLIADDHAIVRQALRAVLEAEADIAVVGEARDGREAVAQAARLKPDVVVMDVAMPRMNGIEATTRIARTLPKTGVLALSIHSGEDFAAALRKAGAKGYLLKETAGSTLIDAVRAIRRGGRLAPSATAIGGEPPGRERPAEGGPLTERERQVLRQIAAGQTSREIGAALGISIKTVGSHRTRVMKKLSIHNVAGLTRYAVSRGLTGPVGPRGVR
jgi:DNA-binding NarL/FixJ family response regulator